MKTYIAFLRGVNVGGNKKLAMADLRTWMEQIGFEAPQTVLQSGNLIFRGKAEACEELERRLAQEAETRLGLRCEFFIRTPEELEAVIQANPFPREAEDDPSHLLVIFLKQAPVEQDVEEVQRAIKGPERIRCVGNQLYAVYPDGIGNSKVSSTPGWNKLASKGTARNWNTLLRIAVLIRG